MSSYYQEKRFRTVAERFIPVSETRDPVFDKMFTVSGSDGRAVLPRDPTPKQTAAGSAHDIIDQLNTALEFAYEYKRNNAVKVITEQIRDQLPFNEEYTVVIRNPGGDNDASVYKGDAIDQVNPSYDSVHVTHLRGRNIQRGSSDPTFVIYTNTPDHIKHIPVQQGTFRSGQAINGGVVDSEPKGIHLDRPRRELPADSKLDPDHPLHRDVSGLA